eukprot:GGOE01042912.1.p1 GENE.GGOE01042912.1~~GGOE01042912.1.p1  ORF type:complete len:342 (-),score=62.33 GGOE01042912.1:63-1088(-)
MSLLIMDPALQVTWLWGPLVLHYFCQPVLFWNILRRPVWWQLGGVCGFALSSLILGRRIASQCEFHHSWGLAFVPHGSMGMKLSHLLIHTAFKKGDFADVYGLSSFSRATAFLLFVPTVVFCPVKHESPNTLELGWEALRRGLLQLLLAVAIAAAVVGLKVHDVLPSALRTLLMVYLVLLTSAGSQDLLFNAPTRLLVGPGATVIDMVLVSAKATSVRDFWRRHSHSTGYHLRKMFYEPLGGRTNAIVATIAPFLYNALFHVYWWAPMYGFVASGFFPCLLLPPLVMVAEHWWGGCPGAAAINFLVLQLCFLLCIPYFSEAIRLPSIADFSRELLGGGVLW